MAQARDFSLPDQTGATRHLADFAGGWLVVYFYPEDDTPGCTTEACGFRDYAADLREQGLQVVGISPDSVASHAKFAAKYHLNFPLLADESRETLKAYGAWGPKQSFGHHHEGVLRKTFLINPAGEIVREYPNVTPEGHAELILKDYKEMRS
jgi:peroxiredoxin Q/BCP